MGPFFTRVLMKELLSLADNEVDRMIATHCLLAVITEDEVELFPAFQFNTDRNQVRASIGHLLQILLASGVNPWVVVYWLTAPIKERENQRSEERRVGREGRNSERSKCAKNREQRSTK